jgi:Flp pilus assembly protein TadG
MMRRTHKSPWKHFNRRGAIVVVAAAFLIVIIAFLAFAIDYGQIVSAESRLQNAADAGAMSGARALIDGRAAAIAAAKSWASKNLTTSEQGIVLDEDVELGRWNDEQATFTEVPEGSVQTLNAVRVTCRRSVARGNPLVLLFARVIGTDHAELTVFATARVNSIRCGPIVGLTKVSLSGSSQTDSYRSDQGAYSPASPGNEGHVCSNGDINMSGSTQIRGNARPGPGHTLKSSSSKGVTGITDPLDRPLNFPPTNPGNAQTVNNNNSIPLSDEGIQPLNSAGEFKLSGGDAVTLPPGTYFFSKMSLTGGASVRVTGPTRIFVSGDCSMGGGSMVNLSLLPKNLKLFPMGANCVISGDSEFYGAIYAPTTKVERSGSSDYFGSIVAGELVLSGSGGVHADLTLKDEPSEGGLNSASLVQ